MIEKIVSGGQTGADRAGLDWAISRGIPYGGWCPKGRRAEDGVIPAKYLLRETTTASYLPRTEQNVIDSDADQRSHTEVLALRVKIYSALKKWDLMQVVAKRLAIMEPETPQWTVSWAYSTRRADCIAVARLILINAVERQPEVAIFHYNLACYECLLGLMNEAKLRLQRAFELEPKWRLMALEDEDLEQLWGSMKE